METNTIIYPFQIVRGILFGLAAVVLLFITGRNRIRYIISVCLVYLCTAVVLIIPNFLFPDAVRIAHLMEMSSSMLVFGFITGMILWEKADDKAIAVSPLD